MPAAVTARCSAVRARAHPPGEALRGVAAGHSPGPAWQGLVVVVYNLLVAVFVPRRTRLFVVPTPVAHRGRSTPTAFDPFVHYTRHSREAMVLRRRAAALRPIHPPAAGTPGTVRRFSPTLPRGTRAGAVSVPYPCRSPTARSNTSFPRSLASLTSPGVPPARGERSNRCCITSTTCKWLMTTATGPRGIRLCRQVAPSHAASLPVARQVGQPAHLPLGARERSRPCDTGGGLSLAAPRNLRRLLRRELDRSLRSGAGSASALYVLSALLVLSALTYGLQNGTPFGVARLLFLRSSSVLSLGVSERADERLTIGDRPAGDLARD